MPTTEDFLAAAAVAATEFGLSVSDISLLSHSENVVCSLRTSDGERLVMRLHRPGYNTMDELAAEVQFVASLGRFGVPVPNAVALPSGEYYTTVDVAGAPHHVGVIEWVDGEPLGGPTAATGPEVVDHYREIGVIAAQIRAHNAAWEAPAGFARRRWDAAGLMSETPLWGRFWQAEDLTDAQRTLFTRARSELADRLGALSTDGDHFGLIHSDLHLGNVMADGNQLTVIDFDDSGYGWFAHELAVSLHPVLDEPFAPDARAALLDGYRSVHPFTAAEEELIDLFLAVRCCMIVGWLDARREVPIYEFFGELAAQTERYVGEYLSR